MNKPTTRTVSIFVKLMSISLLLVIIPVLIVGIIGINSFTNFTEKQTIASMESSSQNKLDLLQQIIEGVKREAYSSAKEPDALSILTSMSNGDTGSKAAEISTKKNILSNYLKDLLAKSNGMFENLFYTDSKGIVIADGTGGKAIGVDISSRDYFAAADKTGEIVASDVVISRSTKRPSMVIAVPLYDSYKKFIGLFGMPIEFNKLTELLIRKTDGIDYNYTILNSKGVVIAHENKAVILKSNMTNEGATQKKLFEQMSQSESGYGFYDLKGVEKLMTYTKYKEQNWYICSSDTVSNYMNPINNFKITIILVGSLCLIIAALIAFLFSRSISKPLKNLSQIADSISKGDLTQKVQVSKSKDEIGQLSVSFGNMASNLRDLILQVNSLSENAASSSQEMMASSEEVSKGSEQIALTITELAKGATEQAAASEKGNEQIITVVEGLKNIALEMSKSQSLVEKAKNTVESGQKSVEYQSIKMNDNLKVSNNVSDAIGSLSEKSSEIGEILSVIKSISDQTNLLALNAAIEAARAGQQGLGFAVVADEIRKLAEQSNVSVREIDKIIEEVQTGVELAVTEMRKANDVVVDQEKALADTIKAFANISQVVIDINSNIKNVSEVSSSLSSSSKIAVESISDIASISQETAAGTEEVAASTEEQTAVIHQIAESAENLSKLSSELQNNISKFTV